jgi:hypothetical protein
MGKEFMRASEFLIESNDAAKAFIQKVYAKYPQTMQNNHVMVWGEGDDQQFAMFELTPSFSKRGAVEVKWFQAYPLRQGVGSRAMKELQALAREDGIALTLFPWDKGQVSQAKLTKFYKGQGFKPAMKGSKNMAWSPELNEVFTSNVSREVVRATPDLYTTKATIGGLIVFNASQYDDDEGKSIWEIDFTEYEKDGTGTTFRKTGSGNELQVFSFVIESIKDLISSYHPDQLTFISHKADDNRTKLYQRMLNRIKVPGYHAAPIDSGEYDDYFKIVKDNLDETELDSTGWGATPQGTDIDYFGLKVKMRPSTFLKLSHPLNSGEQNSDVEKHMQGGGKIAYPFLEIKDPVEWEDGDFSQQGKVVNHEGRNRMTHWIKMKGDEPIQVNVFLRGANRRRYVTDDMIQALSQGLISQTGQLVKNPFEASTALEEAEVATKNSNEIWKQLRAAGYHHVGSGADATVFAKDDSHVIKILMPEDASSKAEQVFRKFYEFSMAHQDLPCVPRFNEVNVIDINGKDYTQIEMERLAPIEKGGFLQGMIWLLSDYTSTLTPWETVESELADADTWEIYSPNFANAFAKTWQSLTQNPASKKTYAMYRQLYNVMKLLYTTGTINKFGWDLHTANVMQRKDGQPVIIDPWFSEGTS